MHKKKNCIRFCCLQGVKRSFDNQTFDRSISFQYKYETRSSPCINISDRGRSVYVTGMFLGFIYHCAVSPNRSCGIVLLLVSSNKTYILIEKGHEGNLHQFDKSLQNFSMYQYVQIVSSYCIYHDKWKGCYCVLFYVFRWYHRFPRYEFNNIFRFDSLIPGITNRSCSAMLQ